MGTSLLGVAYVSTKAVETRQKVEIDSKTKPAAAMLCVQQQAAYSSPQFATQPRTQGPPPPLHPLVVKASSADPSALALCRSSLRLPVTLDVPRKPNQSSASMPTSGAEQAAMAPAHHIVRQCG
jgi:hypothetical protein